MGSILQAKEESWEYGISQLDKRISSTGVGLDGTCMLLVDDGWREAMVGTISLYNERRRTSAHHVNRDDTRIWKETFFGSFGSRTVAIA